MSSGPTRCGPGDPGVPHQVGIDPMLRRRLAGPGTPVDGPQPHLSSAAAPASGLLVYPAGPARPSSASTRRRGSPGTDGPWPASGPGPLPRFPWSGSTGRSDSLPRGRTGASWTMMGTPGPPSSAAATGSWTGPLGQEIPFHLELADLLVQAGDQRGIAPGLLVLTVAENAGGAIGEGLLPSLSLAGVDLVPASQLGHRFLAFHRLQSHLGLESWAVLSPSLGHFPLLLGSYRCLQFRSRTLN